jgi:nanoRNase/pAp phosphatase (c-di-AMP/oligoRNAs hydrolase)
LDHSIPTRLSFLPAPSAISTIDSSRDFLLAFDTSKNKILDVKTDQTESQLIIRLTSQKGFISPKDFSFSPAKFKYDLIFLIGVPALEKLGEHYHKNTDLFFEVPKVNLDHHSSNDGYGQVNLTEATASSSAEILADIILEKYEKVMDPSLAQALLCGIIAATESFQSPTTTPQAMAIAARLMKYKANQSVIVRHLYKTKELSFLKLWGRAMARINQDKKNALAWSLLSQEDFIQSQASENDVPYILEEIQKNFSQNRIFAIIYIDHQNKLFAQLYCKSEKTSQQLAQAFNLNDANTFMTIPFQQKDLISVEKELLNKISNL